MVFERFVLNEANSATSAEIKKWFASKGVKVKVRAFRGKTNAIEARSSEGFPNELRKKVLAVVSPKAKVSNPKDIQFGNISLHIIATGADVWNEIISGG